jgi:hypothetical protein
LSKRNARILRLPNNDLRSFKGLRNFPNVRIIDLRKAPDSESPFSLRSILVAFRSFAIQEINGVPVTDDDYLDSFRYSALVTLALREGMDVRLNLDPIEAIKDASRFLGGAIDGHSVSGGVVTLTRPAERFCWYLLDGDFNWRLLEGQTAGMITSPLNFPMKCELRVNLKSRESTPPFVVFVPEFDDRYHFFGEIVGRAVEGEVISVKASLTSRIEWDDDGNDKLTNRLVYVIPPRVVDKTIQCRVSPRDGLPATTLVVGPVQPAELRFGSVRLEEQLVEDEDIEFEISTRGSAATIKGVRVLRSRAAGEWEPVVTVEADGRLSEQCLHYRLGAQDVGCVIRAVLITSDGSSPLMVTSRTRVEPALPQFTDTELLGDSLGLLLYAKAVYRGGQSGRSIFEWSNGASGRVIVPSLTDVGKVLSCKMTPVRSDGAIGAQVALTTTVKVRAGKRRTQRFVTVKKRHRKGKMQLSFIESPEFDDVASVPEGEMLIAAAPTDWLLIDSGGTFERKGSQNFKVEEGHRNGLIVIIGPDYFAIVGQIVSSVPSASNVEVQFVEAGGVLTVSYEFLGGCEGRSQIEWVRIDSSDDENVVSIGKSHQISEADRNCCYRAIVTPITTDGRRGQATSSGPFRIDDSHLRVDDIQAIELRPPTTVTEDIPCLIQFPGSQTALPAVASVVELNVSPPKRWKFVWTTQGRPICEGQTFTPRKGDVGKVIILEVRDRIQETIVGDCELPPVAGQRPSVRHIELQVESAATHRIFVTANYFGGVEGKSIISWFAQSRDSDRPEEINDPISRAAKCIELGWQFDCASITATYLPVNDRGQSGDSVSSSLVVLLIAAIIRIKDATMVMNAQFTQIQCQVTTERPGRVEYQWAYSVGSELQLTNETTDTHIIDRKDGTYDLDCIVRTFGPNEEAGEERIVCVAPSIAERLRPNIRSAAIRPIEDSSGLAKRKDKDKQEKSLKVGQKHQVAVEYEGPPISESAVRWERRQDDGVWQTIGDSDVYETTRVDQNKSIRAVVRVTVSTTLEKNIAAEFTTDPMEVLNDNPILRRLASTLKRSGKAHFDATLLTGEEVVVVIDGQPSQLQGQAHLAIRQGTVTIFRSMLRDVELDSVEVTSVGLSGRHGYRTELNIGPKKMPGGTEFGPSQARDLFIEVVAAFKTEKAAVVEPAKKQQLGKARKA